MVNQPYISAEYRAYLNSDVWKCAESPTGAHHWVEIRKYMVKSLFLCIHCKDAKEFPTVYSRPA